MVTIQIMLAFLPDFDHSFGKSILNISTSYVSLLQVTSQKKFAKKAFHFVWLLSSRYFCTYLDFKVRFGMSRNAQRSLQKGGGIALIEINGYESRQSFTFWLRNACLVQCMSSDQKIVHARGPFNINLGIFVCSFVVCRAS